MSNLTAMKLERKLTGWRDCSPKEMSKMSEAAIQFALEDARKDLLTMGALLVKIGYPRRGSYEDGWTVYDIAKQVHSLIPHEEAVEL